MIVFLGIITFIGLILLIVFVLGLLTCLDGDLTLSFWDKFDKELRGLSGKVIWITGASGGIGESLAYELAKAKCLLILSARRITELERVKANCLAVGGLRDQDVLVLPMDVTNFDSHKYALQSVLDRFKTLDVLVNNAGKSQRAVFEEISLEVDSDMFDLNVFGTVNLSRLVVKQFMLQRHGHIVVVSSVAGKMGVPGSATYTGSKHALHGYFECLRIEKGMSDNIDVTMLCPGPVVSDILANASTARPNETVGKSHESPKGRMATARCARLSAVAIAHKLDEAWICLPPVLAFYYVVQYMPTIARSIMRRMGLKMMMKIRDQDNTTLPNAL